MAELAVLAISEIFAPITFFGCIVCIGCTGNIEFLACIKYFCCHGNGTGAMDVIYILTVLAGLAALVVLFELAQNRLL